MVSVLFSPSRYQELHPIDRTARALEIETLITQSTSKSEKGRLFTELAHLTQERMPVLDQDGKTTRVETHEEIVRIFMRTLEADSLIESILLGPRFRLTGSQNDDLRCRIAEQSAKQLQASLGIFRGDAELKTYLNEIIYHAHNKAVTDDASLSDDDDENLESSLAEVLLRSSHLIDRQQLRGAIARLAPRHREYILLRYFRQWEARQIMSELNLTIGEHGNRRRQALEEIRRILRDCEYGL